MHVDRNSPPISTTVAKTHGPKAEGPKPHGKDNSPASQARALVLQNEELQAGPFGKIVSAIARNLPVEGASPPEEAPSTPPVDASTDVPADAGSADATSGQQTAPVDINV